MFKDCVLEERACACAIAKYLKFLSHKMLFQFSFTNHLESKQLNEKGCRGKKEFCLAAQDSGLNKKKTNTQPILPKLTPIGVETE